MGQLFELHYVFAAFPRLLPFIPETLFLLFICIVASLLLGTLFALLQLFPLPLLSRLVAVIVSFVLGMPLLTLLFLFYFGLPEIFLPLGIDFTRTNGIYFVVLAFGLHYAVMVSESIRGAVNSVGKGQFEAAFSIGLTAIAALWRIIMPQAMRVLLPNLANIYLRAIKSTSIAFSVGVVDLMSQAQVIGQSTGHNFESYLAVTVIYYLFYLILSAFFKLMEKWSLGLS
ncbi:ABC transporter permease subunit [Acerihabitans sp.]|uniref:ABC transporter permease subunit n=1 Tax=Acerihabitans sp. TaxID=2811394 RepID=UPI002ED7F938